MRLEVKICADRARAGLRHLQSTMAVTMTVHVLYVLRQGSQCALRSLTPQSHISEFIKGLCFIEIIVVAVPAKSDLIL